ncbi:hypothetical protein RGUI_1186 [Rhodovulum sp. P5]|nr:hypothetical protein RGUI_1186 [Rhodovulum sp. P5]
MHRLRSLRPCHRLRPPEQIKNPHRQRRRGHSPDLFSGMFNVARNPVYKSPHPPR